MCVCFIPTRFLLRVVKPSAAMLVLWWPPHAISERRLTHRHPWTLSLNAVYFSDMREFVEKTQLLRSPIPVSQSVNVVGSLATNYKEAEMMRNGVCKTPRMREMIMQHNRLCDGRFRNRPGRGLSAVVVVVVAVILVS